MSDGPRGRSVGGREPFAASAPAPPDDAPVTERLARLLRVQAQACGAMGSPLYAELLGASARDAAAGGPVADLLAHEVADGRSDALALRLMAAVHRLVLTGRAPALAAHYPSVGGRPGPGAWPAFRRTLAEHAAALRELVARPCQTNEVGRCAPLAWGFLEVARRGLPLRLLEVGTSAGLLLRWDRYRYGDGEVATGPADSPVDLRGLWTRPPPAGTDVAVTVSERAGCDPRPVDPTTGEGRLALRAAVWADQLDRLARLEGALAVAGRVPAAVERASVGTWLPARLAEPRPGTATVVFHSVVEEYLDAGERAALHAAVREAGARATADAPVAWLRLEPVSELRHHGVRLTTWPPRDASDGPGADAAGDGDGRLLAVCGAHGHDVRPPPA